MANFITFSRFLLLFGLLAIVYWGEPWVQLVNAPLMLFIITTDALDGYIARKRGEETVFGATFDIAVDRIVENVMWVVLAHLGFVGVWVPLLFICRGNLVDAIRSSGAAKGTAAFDMLRSPIARFIVAGRFMRGFYAVMKALTFAWILLWQPVPELWPAFWGQWSQYIEWTNLGLVIVCASLCVIRGLPVVIEFVFDKDAASAG